MAVALKQFRIQRKMSQGDLARAIGDYDRSSVANLEAGRAQPSLAVAQKLEDLFKVSIRVLLADDPEAPSEPMPGGRPRKRPTSMEVPHG